MTKWLRFAAAPLLLFGVTACEGLEDLTELDVVNENNPDRERVIAEAKDIETIIGTAFQLWWDGWEGSYLCFGCPAGALTTAADEITMSWGNFGMQDLSSEPRVRWDNSPSYRFRGHVEGPWYDMYGALSSAFDGLTSIAAKPDIADLINVDRAKAFAKFIQAISHAALALMFDSAFVFDETVGDLETAELELQPYPAVWAAARGYFEEAISLSQNATWKLESGWINGNALTGPEFAQLARSLLARWEAQVARTPAERDKVDWAKIRQLVDAGIKKDFFVAADGGNLWTKTQLWWGFQGKSTTWGRADYKTIGPADTSGGYQTWLATPVADRNEFPMKTADKRFPATAVKGDRGLDFQFQGPSRFPPIRGIYHYSNYVGIRFEDFPESGELAPMIFIQKLELDYLKAEALLRAGDLVGALAIINDRRVERGGLPPATVALGKDSIMGILIFEKSIENYGACVGCAYFERRGWGPLAATGPKHHRGLVEGSPLHFAPPGKELEILEKRIYTYGGKGTEGQALGHPAAGAVAGAPPVDHGGTRVPAKHVYAFNGLDSIQEKLEHVRRSSTPVLSEGARGLVRY